ncbi:thiamine pyrophosphate-binding protein [Rhodoplanes azumiensis]|uniref:Thiamine pyrophosphate-binding protein n=1 Tax=Rhodoplanes azumiensis TaxID=1897628 RepID=A0ABW5AFT2_9BRAD
MAKGTDFILAALAAEGLDHLFMVPGGLIDPLLPAIGRQTALTPIVAAHEGGAAYMADGYARASGRFGAVVGIGGPGLANMATAVAAARTDSSPVLVLSGEVARAMEGLGAFQDASQATLDDTALMRPLTRLSATVTDAAGLNHWLRHGLTTMLARPRGPVHLSLSRDVLTGDVDAAYAPVSPYFADLAPLGLPQAEAALAALTVALTGGRTRRAMILAGAGVADPASAALLKEVAERWAIPVATTLRAKDVFPEDHPLSLGVFGYAGTRHATAAVFAENLDLLLVLGSGLNERDTMHWTLRARSKAAAIHVNTDMDELTAHCEVTHAVPGSARAFLDLMRNRLDDGAAADAGRAARRSWLDTIKAAPRFYDTDTCARPGAPIHPATAVTALRRAFPRDGIVLVDSGAHRAFMGHHWTAYEPGTYVSATNLGPMGWAIPAAVGVQCARPDRRVAVVTGDGCMHMHGIEVQTAARHRMPIVYVVLNNAALGNVWLRAHTEGPVPAALTSLPDHDWAGFARALGASGFTVTDPARLDETFAQALACGTTAVVDVKTDKACPTPVYDFAAGVAAWSYHE